MTLTNLKGTRTWRWGVRTLTLAVASLLVFAAASMAFAQLHESGMDVHAQAPAFASYTEQPYETGPVIHTQWLRVYAPYTAEEYETGPVIHASDLLYQSGPVVHPSDLAP